MKGYIDYDVWIRVFSILIIFGLVFLWVNQFGGNITISVTGQPTIDSLSYQLTVCQEKLGVKCEPCPDIKCIESNPFPEFTVGMIFGMILGFIYFLWFGEGTKKWMLKRLKKKSKGGL